MSQRDPSNVRDQLDVLISTMKKNQILVVNLSGRGDKDVQLVAKMRGLTL